MIHRLALLLVAAASVAACGLLEPDANLGGRWGGQAISLDARGSGVRIDFVCSSAVAPELPLDGSGRFGGTATVTAVSWAGPRPTELRLSGKVANGVMTLSVASIWPPHGAQTDTLTTFESYTLVLGAAADVSGYDCLL